MTARLVLRALGDLARDLAEDRADLAFEIANAGFDITRDPLEFAINNQHMNGGLAVDTWGETSLRNCYAVGEAAGTHGVTRPGGAALNAGQVFGTRCAEHIAARRPSNSGLGADFALVNHAIERVVDVLKADSALTVGAIRNDVQARMSDYAGILCNANDVGSALDAARALNELIRQQGIAYDGASGALRALQWQQTALLSEAVLTALAFFIEHSGGSRGARALCAPDGDRLPMARTGPLEDFRFAAERPEGRAEQIHVRLKGERFACTTRPVRRRDQSLPAVLRAGLARLPDRRNPQCRSLKKGGDSRPGGHHAMFAISCFIGPRCRR